jgi:NAD(P)-dependent dehydrogenase (short-subunit alcohol dehydrogenase family)
MGLLDNQVALVTGGSSGIGRATALAFGREGASVVIAARGPERGNEVASQIVEGGGEAIFVQTDVSSAADVKNLVEKTVARYGRLDCVLNNAAAYAGMHSLTAAFEEEEFDQTVAVTFKGVWLCMKHEIQQMLAQEPAGGVIVNVSSVSGLAGTGTAAIYSAVKAAVLTLTKSAALEYAQHGIRINSLVPGAFQTPMLQWGYQRGGSSDPELARMMEEHVASAIPMGRIGSPREAAEAVVWLCSDASSYVTGHSLIVDGGISAAVR